MDENEHESPRMSGDWTEPEEDEEVSGRDPIESSFRDGDQRIRDSDGRYKSISDAIIENYEHSTPPSPDRVARDLDISERVAREHIEMLKKRGILGY
jgi:hypothetical protein